MALMTDTYAHRNAGDTPRVTLLIEGFYTDVPAAPGNVQINYVTHVPGQGWWGFGTQRRAAEAALAVADFHPVYRVWDAELDTDIYPENSVIYDGCAIDIVYDID